MSKQGEDVPFCWECGYNLTGIPDRPRCPECGWKIDWAKAFQRRHRFVLSKITLSILLTLSILVVPIQLELCSGGSASLSLVGERNGYGMDRFFRKVYNTITVLQMIEAAGACFLMVLKLTDSVPDAAWRK